MILLWDSSEMVIHYALVLDSGRRIEYEWEAGRTSARDMLLRLRDALSENSATFTALSGIGVMQGPGSFTGLRIGLTVLNTIATDLSIPIVGVQGSSWRDAALERLARGESDTIVMPFYGSEAHVTKPRK